MMIRHEALAYQHLSCPLLNHCVVVALILRVQPPPSPPSSETWPPTTAGNLCDSALRQRASPLSEKSAPTSRQLKLPQDALSYLIDRLEKDPDSALITPDDIARLRTTYKALLSAAYYSLYMAAELSATSEDSCWIGSGLARSGGHASAFKERDWANGRVYYEGKSFCQKEWTTIAW